MTIRFASFLGDNALDFYRQVVAYVGEVSGLPTEMAADTSAGLEAMFAEERIEAAFGCGLPYVWKAAAERESPTVRLMAAPVLPADRYHDQPIYFSDVIVRADSPYQTFEDLRGATFAYNQTASFSGYVLPLYRLLTLGETNGFFGKTVASGSHAVSMDWVENGQADAAAIDSVVLEMELAQRPERAKTFRAAASLGPAGMPPVMASSQLSHHVHKRLTETLVSMDQHERGQAVLRRGGVRRFAPVTDQNYDGIRQMLKALQHAEVTELR
jgi:phosphonate transport system substrate-binding protein